MDERQLGFQIDVCVTKHNLQQLPRDEINNKYVTTCALKDTI